METVRRIQVVVGATVVLAGWWAATGLSRLPVLIVVLPTVVAAWLLVLLHHGYLLGRACAHRRRRRDSRSRREQWAPAADIRRPIDYTNVVPRPAAESPVDQQGRFRAIGIRLATLPLLAVLFLTAQTVFLQHSDDLGLGLVLAECLLLGWLVWTVWSEQQPSQAWVASRIRAELFRREMFLLLAGVGPYLGRSTQQTGRIRDARTGLLAAAGAAELDDFARLAERDTDGAERYWQDEVWRRASDGVAGSCDDLGERMRTYLAYRIRRQRLYMELAAEKSEGTESVLGKVAKGVALGAVAVAVSYAVVLGVVRDGRAPSTAAAVIAVLAAGLAPLCNSVLAVQNLLAGQRLAASYHEARQELLGHENTLRRLMEEPEGPDLAVAFRALVVRTEATLTEELRRWRITVAKPEFDAGL
ncbi:hypothetical protein [Streptomyces sp. NPDC002265]|uniref:hypothetical protein n=1 Tax=Streptomyces sp. NPDC002265 TaxID=3154415 RepID=UPI00331DC84C